MVHSVAEQRLIAYSRVNSSSPDTFHNFKYRDVEENVMMLKRDLSPIASIPL
jgi:hypothetical protein